MSHIIRNNPIYRDGDSAENAGTTLVGGINGNEKIKGVRVNASGQFDITQTDLNNVFTAMLVELKKLNLYMAMASDYMVNDSEVE